MAKRKTKTDNNTKTLQKAKDRARQTPLNTRVLRKGV